MSYTNVAKASKAKLRAKSATTISNLYEVSNLQYDVEEKFEIDKSLVPTKQEILVWLTNSLPFKCYITDTEIPKNTIELDHKIPLSSAKTEKEIYQLNHHTNLQPMWHVDNMKKRHEVIYQCRLDE